MRLGLRALQQLPGQAVEAAPARIRLATTPSVARVRLSPRSVPSPHHHFLCWKPGTLERWECAAFVDWLRRSMDS